MNGVVPAMSARTNLALEAIRISLEIRTGERNTVKHKGKNNAQQKRKTRSIVSTPTRGGKTHTHKKGKRPK